MGVMNCYNHPDSPAHGFCAVCQKALGRACMAEGVDVVCCRGACQTKAKSIDEIILTAKRGGGIYLLLLGLVLFLAAVMLGSKNEPITGVIGVIGIGVFLGGAIRFFRGRTI